MQQGHAHERPRPVVLLFRASNERVAANSREAARAPQHREHDEEVELVVWILSVALSLAAGSLFNKLAEDVGPFARLRIAGGLVDTSKIES